MLAAFLIAGLVASILSTIVLLLPWPNWRLRSAGAWPWSRRLLLALIGTAAADAVVYGVMRGLGATHRNVFAALAALTLMSLLWLPATRRWNARGHVCWSATVFLFAAYLAFMLQWTFTAGMPATSEAGGVALWVLELFAAVLGCAYLWELCDALASEHWRRRVSRGAPAVVPGGDLPFVSLQVPAHNEPPDMVIATLSALRELDYPRYQVVAIDDNTDDEALWRPVEEWCRDNGVKFAHLADWPGYKSGALNYALANLTDPAAELIGVVDADYHMDPDFLRRCAPLFGDPALGFIQAPQDYRDWQHASYYRRLYYSYSYFFAVSQPSRNERDGAIFAGTMGLIRRRALEEVGGWDEWCITEDAELSLRLLRAGWSGLHVDKSFGYGVMPLTFEALKGQRFRWCFGGIQILRMHWRSLVSGFGDDGNRLTLGQRWAYLSGALQWYGDFLALLFFFFLLGGAINIASGGGLLFRKLSAFLIATIGLLVGIGIVRAVALLRRRTGAGWRDAIGAFLMWQSTSLITARASVQALFAKQAEFLRTPKTTEEAKLLDAIKGNWGETLLMLAGLGGIAAAVTHPLGYAGPLTAGLLLWPTIAYGTALVNSVAAQRAALPADLRARRRTEFLRTAPTRRLSLAAGGLFGAGAVVVGVLVLLTPGHQPVVPPNVIGPAQGHRATAPATSAPASATASSAPTGSAPTSSASPSIGPTSSASPSSASPSATTPSASSTPTPTSTTTAGASGTPTANASPTP